MKVKQPKFIELAKERLINLDMFGDGYFIPWYASELESWSSMNSYGISDRHAKLIRHMVEALMERHGGSYSSTLSRTCSAHSYYDYRRGYADSNDCTFIWAFSMLADMFDEPFAQKCFDEYLDNERLDGLTVRSLYSFMQKLDNSIKYCPSWEDCVNSFRNGTVIAVLDKNRFWQFLQQAVGVGLGKRLSGYLELYADYLKQAYACDGKIKEKYPEHLQEMHDIYSEKYTVLQEFRDEEKLRKAVEAGSPVIDQVHEDYQLKMLDSIKAFYEEAQQNCNCVASYVDSVAAGKCWVASFRRVGSPATQLTIEVDPHSGEMVQIRGKFNRYPTEDELTLLEKFRTGIREKMKAAAKAVTVQEA